MQKNFQVDRGVCTGQPIPCSQPAPPHRWIVNLVAQSVKTNDKPYTYPVCSSLLACLVRGIPMTFSSCIVRTCILPVGRPSEAQSLLMYQIWVGKLVPFQNLTFLFTHPTFQFPANIALTSCHSMLSFVVNFLATYSFAPSYPS